MHECYSMIPIIVNDNKTAHLLIVITGMNLRAKLWTLISGASSGESNHHLRKLNSDMQATRPPKPLQGRRWIETLLVFGDSILP